MRTTRARPRTIRTTTGGTDAMKVLRTVLGPVPMDQAGIVLPHEHVMVDFVGAEWTGEHRWDKDEVVAVMEPYLNEVAARGVQTFVDCSPKFLGRDPVVLRRLSERTGLHILTNTGLYKEPYLPAYALTQSAEALAEAWIREATDGIDGTGVLPGFIKIAVAKESLAPVQHTIVRAAGLCSRATGLTIAVHTGHGPAALESTAILRSLGVPLERYIFVHADSEKDVGYHKAIAEQGGWIEYDGIGNRPTERLVAWTTAMIEAGHLDRLLLSHDAGWYEVGEPGGGTVRPFTALFDEFLPALRQAGVDEATVDTLVRRNPAQAYAV